MPVMGAYQLADKKDTVVFGFIGIGVLFIIAGLIRQGYQLNGAQNWLSNDLYVAGAILVIIGFAIGMLWKD